MQDTKFIFIYVFFTLFQVSIFAEQTTEVSRTEATSKQVLEQTTIKTTDGEIIHVDRTKNGLLFKGYEEKIVLLDAFGHSCGPCRASIPGYNRLQKKYQKDIVVIAIEAWGSDIAGLKTYVTAHGIEYKAVPSSASGKILSFIKKLTGWHPGMGVPYLMLFSRGGALAKDVPPQAFPEEYVNELIKELL